MVSLPEGSHSLSNLKFSVLQWQWATVNWCHLPPGSGIPGRELAWRPCFDGVNIWEQNGIGSLVEYISDLFTNLQWEVVSDLNRFWNLDASNPQLYMHGRVISSLVKKQLKCPTVEVSSDVHNISQLNSIEKILGLVRTIPRNIIPLPTTSYCSNHPFDFSKSWDVSLQCRAPLLWAVYQHHQWYTMKPSEMLVN